MSGEYWRGYSDALKELLRDFAAGDLGISEFMAPSNEKEKAWRAGYQDGRADGFKLIKKSLEEQSKRAKETAEFYAEQTREPERLKKAVDKSKSQ